ncbi:carbamoyltransferase HypF [Collinsella sp. An2]|uniref:carbamoyltransferase HypF n=1 Tax=Collinsella sp. An2 TaxID=1965585 RepID=UPI000B37EE0B|nr:carbamoyltransferase HypF [Collinsella sp. An2]OUP07534.1 hydrogenase maturation protein HypF [Collinsella sp. An2]
MRDAHIHITGIVQGVGMRPFVYREAIRHGIAGWVLNAGDGVHVEVHAASDEQLASFVAALRDEAPAAARIDTVQVIELPAEAASSTVADDSPSKSGERRALASDSSPDGAFRIVASDDQTERTTLVSPDIATCPDCLRELFDPADRRYHYPFINCTNCGPRFTIIRSLPYDRPATSMDAFPMCATCAAEYADPADRRFHAQPDACFECGPHITWRERTDLPDHLAECMREVPAAPSVGQTRTQSDAIIDRCARMLAAGGIVAIKGLGGFHLACDASNEHAAQELRRRKRRSNKPLAVMVGRLEDACALCHIDDIERALLEGTVRPIVLLRRREHGARARAAADQAASPEAAPNAAAEQMTHAAGATTGDTLAPSVAFDLPELGIMLPYTPLQHLLLAACSLVGVSALVMTSGNVSEEPIETDDRLAWQHLVDGGLADALLGNDRAILARYDDSVVRVVAGTPMLVRRARGYAPRPLALPAMRSPSCDGIEPSMPTILACGSEQKATLAFTREQEDGSAACLLSQHIGDVENAATFDAWHEVRRRFATLFDLEPQVLACDLHPSYLASQWARETAREQHLPLIEVQHHHAHLAAVIAEAAARGELAPNAQVIGVAFDGTGAGTDGTIWGGEFLVAGLSACRRAAHLMPWHLPGGAASVRDARRNAFALLHACNLLDHPGAAPLLVRLTPEERSITETMVARGINSPLTSSMGRFLDAVSAMLGICDSATYEGEPAILLEAAATREQSCLPASPIIDAPCMRRRQGSLVLDPTPLLCSLLDNLAAGARPEQLALGVHEAVARMAAETAALLAQQTGIGFVALSGGVFMNRLLLGMTRSLLEDQGLHVLVPRDVPVNDGCIAYGQAAVAHAILAQRDMRAS